MPLKGIFTTLMVTFTFLKVTFRKLKVTSTPGLTQMPMSPTRQRGLSPVTETTTQPTKTHQTICP